MDRRVFMKSGAMALVTMGLSPSFLRRSAFGAELMKGAASRGGARGKTLICLFQRGAADALNVVVPHGDAAYYRLRPNIAIPRPSLAAGPAGALDLDGFFGLFFSGFPDLLLIASLTPLCGLPQQLVTGRILPAVAFSILFGNLFYAWQARKLAQKTNHRYLVWLGYGGSGLHRSSQKPCDCSLLRVNSDACLLGAGTGGFRCQERRFQSI